MNRRLPLAAALLVLVAVLPACDEDDPGAVLDMATLWPHADGSTWSYAMDYAYYDELPDMSGPGVPSMEALRADLLATPDVEPVSAASALYDLGLDGEVTTDSGVTAQRMTEAVTPLDAPARHLLAAGGPAPARERLLRLVARARPDLRGRIGDVLGDDPGAKAVAPRPAPPFFLGGYAFAYEDSGYYGYGDVTGDHERVYLEAPLQPGHEFSLQPLPGLAPDIVIRSRIWSVTTRRGVDGNPRVELECMHVLDMGETTLVDEHGDVLGRFRSLVTALVWYMPGVGPVAARERHVLVPTAAAKAVVGPQIMDITCRLENAALPPAD